MCSSRVSVASVLIYSLIGFAWAAPVAASDTTEKTPAPIMLTVLGDSLSHGTMDATNN